MEKVFLFGEKKAEIEPLVKAAGFTVVEHDPELVISYGGDGTLMRAEFAFPGVPKLALKGSRICKFCSPLSNEAVLRLVRDGKFRQERLPKLRATAGGVSLLAMNDVTVHNDDPRHAIRYRVSADAALLGGELTHEEIIGDGVVVATPLGSTGYYRSITDSSFETGIGLAFNNSTEQSDHIVLRHDRRITVRIVRGPATVFADNQQAAVRLADGDTVTVEVGEDTATVLVVE